MNILVHPLLSLDNYLFSLYQGTKLKAFADDKSKVTTLIICIFLKVKTIVGKVENASDQHFLLFPQRFQKPSLVGKVLTHYHIMPHFDLLKIYSCGKLREKRRNPL